MTTATTKSRPVYRAIAAALQKRLAACSPGEMLPSEAELARQFKVNLRTLRQALEVLSQEGLVRRYHGRGTVVQDRKAAGEIAIVLRPQLFSADTHPYYSLMNGLFTKLLQERNPRWQVRLHIGKLTETGEQYPATLDLVEPDVLRKLRGVFTFHPLHEIGPQLAAAHVPVVNLHSYDIPHVWLDMATLFSVGLAHLKETGCKTVGMVWTARNEAQVPTHRSMVFFQRAIAASGLKVRPEWMKPCLAEDATEQYGYETMSRLWKNRSHPEGILVVDDMLCRGVLRAALQLDIEFPRDLRLVTFANHGIALNYHKPVSRVEFDPEEQARKAVEMMLTLMEGRALSPAAIDLPVALIKGETT